MAQFKHGDFSTRDVPHPVRPKTVSTPHIIEQIHELVLEDHRILAKSIAGQLTWMGSAPHSWRFGRSEALLRSGSKNAWMLIEKLLEFFRLSMIQIISCHDWWSWTKPGYSTMTWRQSHNHWSGGIAVHPTPKNSACKNPLVKLLPQFFGIKMASSSLIIFQGAKLSMRSITNLRLCNWRTFWRKNAAGRSPRESCSCTTMLLLTRHLQPRRNWPTWASSVFITHPIIQIWPHCTTACSLDWKNNWKVTIFRPTRR